MLDRFLPVIEKSGVLLVELTPYILIGVLAAELLKYTPWTRMVREATGNRPVLSLFISAGLGIVSPLCTYGTIPIVIDLYKGGVRLAPLLTFLSASSLMNPQLFVITCGGLGAEVAVIRILSVILFVIILGSIILIIETRRKARAEESVNKRFKRTCSTELRWRDFKFRAFFLGFYRNLEFVGFYIVIGILLSMLIEAFIPLEFLLQSTSKSDWLSVLVASLMGIPLYACGGGTIPLVDMLMQNGMSLGAAIAFLIVGPGTRITPLMALGSFLSLRTLVIYIIGLLGFGTMLGMILNLLHA
jgi:uncharacterized membrane protein YraQ (UPF0718 family)